MPRGDKSSYTSKQKRKAEHIEEGYEASGISEKEAERRAWATVNKESGGGKKSGSGRGKKESQPRRGRADGSAVAHPRTAVRRLNQEARRRPQRRESAGRRSRVAVKRC